MDSSSMELTRVVFARRWITVVLALWLSLGSACRPTAPRVGSVPGVGAAVPLVYPGATWDSITNPQTLGWSRAGLDSVRARLSTMPSTGFVAVLSGQVLMSYGDIQAISYLASVRKSVLSMLYGIYVERGKINLDKTLTQLGIDDIGGLTPAEREATIRDLISARSGVYHAASNDGDDLASAPPRGSQKHGAYYLYSNWDFNAAGAAFELETGRNIYDALENDLAVPIQMQDFKRTDQRKSGDTTKSKYLAYHMYLSTRDMARIGYLMLRHGNWAGKQVVPRDWVRLSTSAITKVNEMNPERRRSGPWGYGYLWWVWDGPDNTGPFEGSFTGLGAVGQHITVLPKLDLVIAHKTRPGGSGSVSHQQFLQVLEILLRAHCQAKCAA